MALKPGSHYRILKILKDSEIRLYHTLKENLIRFIFLNLKHAHTTRFENNDQHTPQYFIKIIGPESDAPHDPTSSHKEANANKSTKNGD